MAKFKTINTREETYKALRKLMAERQLGTLTNAMDVLVAEAIVRTKQQKK